MVDDHPILTVPNEGEAITRWQTLGFPVLDPRERVVAGVDGGATVNSDQLLAERDSEPRQELKGCDEIVAHRCAIRPHGWGQRPPENPISGIEKNDLVWVVFSPGLGPLHCRSGNVLLRSGRSDGADQ